MSAPRLTVAEHGTTVAACVSGDIDAANAAELYEALETSVTQTTDVLAVDLSALTYLDSAGIHMLYRIARELEDRGARLELVVPPGSVVEETLRYADALRLFAVVDATQNRVPDPGD
jgi:anti-sigma B factor antagonist